jgi:hypothetical protein
MRPHLPEAWSPSNQRTSAQDVVVLLCACRSRLRTRHAENVAKLGQEERIIRPMKSTSPRRLWHGHACLLDRNRWCNISRLSGSRGDLTPTRTVTLSGGPSVAGTGAGGRTPSAPASERVAPFPPLPRRPACSCIPPMGYEARAISSRCFSACDPDRAWCYRGESKTRSGFYVGPLHLRKTS